MTRTDAEFCQDIIDLIDGTHWTKGNLQTYCMVPRDNPIMLPEDEEGGDGIIYYHKISRMQYTRDLGVWRNTVPSKRKPVEEPKMRDYGAEDILVGNSARSYHYALTNPHTFRIVRHIEYYKKSQWCLVGMILRIADLEQDEDNLFIDNPWDDQMQAENRKSYGQAWRIIDQMAANITSDAFRQTGRWVIQCIEEWNDTDGRTKEEVRALVVQTRDQLGSVA